MTTLRIADELHNYVKRTNKYWMRVLAPRKKTASLLKLVSFTKDKVPSAKDVPPDVSDFDTQEEPVAVDWIVQPSLMYEFALNETNWQDLPADSKNAGLSIQYLITVSAPRTRTTTSF